MSLTSHLALSILFFILSPGTLSLTRVDEHYSVMTSHLHVSWWIPMVSQHSLPALNYGQSQKQTVADSHVTDSYIGTPRQWCDGVWIINTLWSDVFKSQLRLGMICGASINNCHWLKTQTWVKVCRVTWYINKFKLRALNQNRDTK